MVSIYHDNIQAVPSDYSAEARTDTLEADLGRELGRETFEVPVQPVRHQPLRTALSVIRGNLDQRLREWRGSAKVVEQSLRQLGAAEQARAETMAEFERAQAEVRHTTGVLTEVLVGFDESDDVQNIDPLFERSQQALDELDRITGELSIVQEWCRSAWRQYAEALRREQALRFHIQSARAA